MGEITPLLICQTGTIANANADNHKMAKSWTIYVPGQYIGMFQFIYYVKSFTELLFNYYYNKYFLFLVIHIISHKLARTNILEN